MSYYLIQLFLSPQLRNMTQGHKTMCGCKIFIQDLTYQESLNHWCKRRLRYINNHANSSTLVSVETFNAENI